MGSAAEERIRCGCPVTHRQCTTVGAVDGWSSPAGQAGLMELTDPYRSSRVQSAQKPSTIQSLGASAKLPCRQLHTGWFSPDFMNDTQYPWVSLQFSVSSVFVFRTVNPESVFNKDPQECRDAQEFEEFQEEKVTSD